MLLTTEVNLTWCGLRGYYVYRTNLFPELPHLPIKDETSTPYRFCHITFPPELTQLTWGLSQIFYLNRKWAMVFDYHKADLSDNIITLLEEHTLAVLLMEWMGFRMYSHMCESFGTKLV